MVFRGVFESLPFDCARIKKTSGLFRIFCLKISRFRFSPQKSPLGGFFDTDSRLYGFAFVRGAVHFANDGLFADSALGRFPFGVFLGAELVGGAGLEKHLLVTEDEFFVGLGGVLERVYDHAFYPLRRE